MERHSFMRQLDSGYAVYDINLLEKEGICKVSSLPFTIKILVENLLRHLDGKIVREKDLLEIAGWKKKYEKPVEIPFHPGRVLMQDFTGVPAVVDLAAMRDAVKDNGGDPKTINPMIPVELVIDHSVQLDSAGSKESLNINVDREYERNTERYRLLKWAQKSFDNFSVVPPNSGICHQVNLEYLGRVMMTSDQDGEKIAFPDTLVGTDSHTTMINGIGVAGWGVGGIEAEAVMLGQPYYMSIPQVVGVKLTGVLNEGITATDLVLTVTERLRQHNVVEKFVEFFGSGLKKLGVTDRATISNMAPEYGATVGFCPVDEKTVEYLKLTGRDDRAELVGEAAHALGLFYTGENDPEYSEVVEIDLSRVEASVAGPSRPQDRIPLSRIKSDFKDILSREGRLSTLDLDGKKVVVGDGSVVIASITSCTNTSNPGVMMGAGIVAKKAVEFGLTVPSHVKTSLVPGSRVVVDYLEDADLMTGLEALGFHAAGFGCGTCIGNSGPLHKEIESAIAENDLNTASVVSGNRNFEARIHQSVKSNFLASPLLVVAFAIAGRVDIDLESEPLGNDPAGKPVFLKDLLPGSGQVEKLVANHVKKEFFTGEYAKIFDGDSMWQSLEVEETPTFQWDVDSTYIRKPPFFENFSPDMTPPSDIESARTLLVLGNSVTTDHISPAGAIPEAYPAGRYLVEKGTAVDGFNSYGSRRGNHEVMMRGTFANIRIKNSLVSPKEGGLTLKFPAGDEQYVFDAAMAYQAEGSQLIVLGGREYGTGSSRDWAAKGTYLLGVGAVIVESFERIHRSNLVGMGVLPLVFKKGESIQTLGLTGSESFSIRGLGDINPREVVTITALKKDGSQIQFETIARLDTDIEVAYFKNGGILSSVLKKMI